MFTRLRGFCHDMEAHGICFEATLNIAEIEIEIESPLFNMSRQLNACDSHFQRHQHCHEHHQHCGQFISGHWSAQVNGLMGCLLQQCTGLGLMDQMQELILRARQCAKKWSLCRTAMQKNEATVRQPCKK